MNKLKIRGRS